MEVPRKKILFAITKSNWGGAGRYVYDLATHLPKEDFDVVVACGPSGIHKSGGTLKDVLTEAGIRTILIPSLGRDVHPLRDISAYRSFAKIVREERPDILHLNSSKIGALGAVLGRWYRVPKIIFTAHGWPFWEKRNIISRILIFSISWFTLLLSHITICVSRNDRNGVSFLPFTKKKLMVIHNGIAPLTLLHRQEARARLHLPPEAKVVGTIAELHKNKNIIDGIKGVIHYNTHHEASLDHVIIGEGDERDKIEKTLHTYTEKERARIHLLGFIQDAATYLLCCDIFLLPSKKEGLPYVLLEAGSAGLPVVAHHTGGIPEIITHKEDGFLLEKTDKESISHGIHDCLENGAHYGQHLQKKVEHLFSLKKMVEETRKVYDA